MKCIVKKCPFCGGRTFVQRSIEEDDMWDYTNGFYIACRDCQAEGPFMPFDSANMLDNESLEEFENRTKRECIKKWNEAIERFGIDNGNVMYEDSSLPPNVEKATEKQLKFAEVISDALSIKLPKEQSKQTLRKFISDNIEAFKKNSASRKSSHGYDWGDSGFEIYDEIPFDEF